MKMERSIRHFAESPGTVALATEVQAGFTGGCGHAMERNERGI